jgi:hypothetical protein
MSVDPVDDQTMWFTSLYQKSNGQFNWSTWIHAFTIGTPAPTPGISVTPRSLDLRHDGSGADHHRD